MWLLPLTTAAIGWAAAAAIGRPRPASAAVPVLFAVSGGVAGSRDPTTPPEMMVPHVMVPGEVGRGRYRAVYVLLVCTVATIALILLAAGLLAG